MGLNVTPLIFSHFLEYVLISEECFLMNFNSDFAKGNSDKLFELGTSFGLRCVNLGLDETPKK